MKNKIIIFLIIILLSSCKVQNTTTSGHDCSSLQKDSIFITGEHIHLLPEKLCSYAEDEWYVFENDIDTNYLNID
tara:strand:- start:1681 stop:1905 length:225 start_codon:yes stop_codon:yes gene_type:complete